MVIKQDNLGKRVNYVYRSIYILIKNEKSQIPNGFKSSKFD